MKINEAYTIMAGVSTLFHLIAFFMAASVILCCAKGLIQCSFHIFMACVKVGHYWFVMFILAGNWKCRTCFIEMRIVTRLFTFILDQRPETNTIRAFVYKNTI